MMNSASRREQVLKIIQKSDRPCSASALAKQFQVSRQIIVGDIALLRASGIDIIATPRGYVLESLRSDGMIRTIAVAHQEQDLAEELYAIVDQGGTIMDVIVEHPLYGQLSGKLHISSRYDVEQFIYHVQNEHVKPLSNLTNGLHLHTIRCKDEETFQRILNALRTKGFLYENLDSTKIL